MVLNSLKPCHVVQSESNNRRVYLAVLSKTKLFIQKQQHFLAVLKVVNIQKNIMVYMGFYIWAPLCDLQPLVKWRRVGKPTLYWRHA